MKIWIIDYLFWEPIEYRRDGLDSIVGDNKYEGFGLSSEILWGILCLSFTIFQSIYLGKISHDSGQ